jgi:hypothetical protein
MSHAHNTFPLTTAIAAGTRTRVCGSLMCTGLPGMDERPYPHPIDRGVSR